MTILMERNGIITWMKVVLLDIASLDLRSQRDLELSGRSISVRDKSTTLCHLNLKEQAVVVGLELVDEVDGKGKSG